MEPVIERELILPRVMVQLATMEWGEVEESRGSGAHYFLCQRLSDNHQPLRIGNFNAREAFPRVRSVGFMPPGRSVRLYPVDGPFRVLNCVFEKDYFEATTGIGQEQWEEHTGALVSIKDRRLEVMMQEIHAELVQPGFAHELLIEAASTMLLVEVARYGRRLAMNSGKAAAGQGLAPWQLRRIQERIEASPDIGYPGLGELAKLCGISQSHLMRSFKTSTGWQIHKYIAEDRLAAAKRMLAQEHFNSKEISARLGFRSPAYFATAFRRMTGVTPSDFRKQARAGETAGG